MKKGYSKTAISSFLTPTSILWHAAILGARDIIVHAVGNTTSPRLHIAYATVLLFLKTPEFALVIVCAGLLTR